MPIAHEQVGRRLRFRDLQVLFAVAECGSMAKAAAQLRLTQPAVSEVVASLEHMFAVRLFDRNPRGVALTVYGEAVLKRGRAAYDELGQGIRDIDFLSDPTTGEVRIGCPASVLGGTLSLAVESFCRRYPRVVLRFDEVTSPGSDFSGLRKREHDLVLARIARPLVGEDDLDVEVLFQDELLVAADKRSPWARRRRIDPAELIDAAWILAGPDSWVYASVAAAFRARALPAPKITIVALSGHLRMSLAARGPFVTVIPSSLLRFNADQLSLKVLPVDLRIPGFPVAILALKNRVLNPLVGIFADHVRAIARTRCA